MSTSTIEPLPTHSTTESTRSESLSLPLPVHLRRSSSTVTLLNPSPPPYQFPPSTITPLSFYPSPSPDPPAQVLPFSTLTPLSPSPPAYPLTSPRGSTSPESLPSYSQVPQTLAERCFVFGFLFPPIWILGLSKYWFSQRPHNFLDLEKHPELGLDPEEGSRERERVEESMRSWREEEIVWSLRCAWCLGAVVALGCLAGIVTAALMGKI
ncbi:uncharacterized protein JCM6883_007297 [Sporobolomyces salmoneus]|uniref:uncharacterized protein n=1 Tax=Sporobolomyces salmoneus TaxID=183962 RepID=UPI00316D24E5